MLNYVLSDVVVEKDGVEVSGGHLEVVKYLVSQGKEQMCMQ
jgi:hypothetical protein